MKKLFLILFLCATPIIASAQVSPFSDIVLTSRGTPAGGASISVCANPGLATTGASVTSNIGILTMGSNPVTAGFVPNMSLTVAGFTGADTYFNGSFTTLTVTSTQVTYQLVHANASATSNGTAFQTGTASQACAPLSSIFSDPAGLVPITQPGFTADGLGNYAFFAAPGSYSVQFYGPVLTVRVKPINIPCIPGVTCASVTLANTWPADQFFKSGRPWFDVMAFGAKNDGSTDDTTAVQAAITAACNAGSNGPTGIVYFPPAKTTSGLYFFGGTTSPIVLSCDGLALIGAGVPNQAINSADNFSSKLYAPNLVNTAIVTTSGGTRYGILIHGLGFQGHGASPAGIQGINVTMNGIIEYSGFNNLGSSAIVTNSAANAQVLLTKNVAIGCLMGGAAVDTGCYDLSGNDVIAEGNYAQVGVTGLGNLGTGHRFSWVIRGCCGAYTDNFGELSEQGWEVIGGSANYNRFTANRAVLNQGAGFINQGVGNIFNGNISISNSQTANNNSPGFSDTAGGQSSIFQGNECVDNGTGVLVSNCFNDSNNNSTQTAENQYSNNRAQSNAVAGTLYNFTGTGPYRVIQPTETSADRGDNSVTVQCWLDADTQFFGTPLTANRTVTLSTTGAWNGCKFRVIRSVAATGASTLTVGSIVLTPGATADFEFIAGSWRTSIAPPQTVSSGVQALNTASITTATCDTGVAATANGTLSTDRVVWDFNAALTATNKYGAFLVVYAVPSTNTVTFYTCNPSATTSTPTAMSVNWSVVR